MSHPLSLHTELTSQILSCCFEVANELGSGFLENVYKNALLLALKESSLSVEVEKSYEVIFRNKRVGLYRADLIVEEKVLIELKCVKTILPEHQAQVINYLKTTGLSVAILINYGQSIIDYKRLHHPSLM